MSDQHIDKASRLFQFLSDLRKLQEKPVLKTEEYTSRGGQIFDVASFREFASGDLPLAFFGPTLGKSIDHPLRDGHNDSNLVIKMKRPRFVDQPTPTDAITPWLSNDGSSPKRRPSILDQATINNVQEQLGNQDPSFRRDLEQWLERWDEWSEMSQAMSLYQQLFEAQVKANQQSDEFELVLGLGNLSWNNTDANGVNRHIFVSKLTITMDKNSGTIEIALDDSEITPELEAIPRDQLADGRFIGDIRDAASRFEGNPLSVDAFEELGKRTAHSLTTDARYISEVTLPAGNHSAPRLFWAPTVILRPRQRTGLSTSFTAIADAILESGEIPEGLTTLIDPNVQQKIATNSTPGAIIEVGDEIYSPLPLNDRQRAVIQRVDTHAQTIVQGPPGTGKTHMAAALLSHLLAQGQRVLVTAETDRALYELRDKLPAEIRELAVSVLGSSAKDMADLEVAISTIERRSTEFDAVRSDLEISSIQRELRAYEERKVKLQRKWAERLKLEQSSLGVEGYDMPVAEAIEEINKRADEFKWFWSVGVQNLATPFPLNDDELTNWFQLLDKPELSCSEYLSEADSLDLDTIPTAHNFKEAIDSSAAAHDELKAVHSALDQDALSRWRALSPESREAIKRAASDALTTRQKLTAFQQSWTNEILAGSPSVQLTAWQQRLQSAREHLGLVEQTNQVLKDTRRVSVQGQTDAYVPTAKNLLVFLESGGTINTRADGSVKAGLFTKSIIKESLPFFENVSVDSLPPTTADLVEKYLAHVERDWSLQRLRDVWPYIDDAESTTDPLALTAAYSHDLSLFDSYLDSQFSFTEQTDFIASQGFSLNPSEPSQLTQLFQRLDDALSAQKRADEATQRLTEFDALADQNGFSGPRFTWMDELSRAITMRDSDSYQEAIESARATAELAKDARKLASYSQRVNDWSKTVYKHIVNDVPDGEWRKHARNIEEARRWRHARNKIHRLEASDIATLQSEIATLDNKIHNKVARLAALRAWSKAVGGSRIDARTRSTLVAYTQAVKRLGKGTGKYADEKRREVRRHLDASRGAVPVWIMPLYKIVDQFNLEENMFDVVIVDEASQAGIDSVFLQYLAPRIVVIGDDKQVSPSAVGVDRQEIKDVARQYLYDFDHIDSWTDPQRSLFDDAEMRYGGRIVLTEHRRCVPEIIEFSNDLVYRPNNIELRAVREVSPGRLAPFKITRTPNAFEENKTNKSEADILVRRLIETLDDPAYDNKSMGVISLLSTSKQAKYLQTQLLEKLPPDVWEERDLKIGTPAEFQGAERDVMFLTMVTPASPDSRLRALTSESYLQRYNVAVSRAKDQVWLFHSIGVEDLSHPDDVRRRLLDHAYHVAQAKPEEKTSELVSDTERTPPFDSLFEQRVYNQLVSRGYHVIPQYDAHGYKIDLVVEGPGGRLAVECDGDYWHGDDQAKADQTRQRELERLGWRFVRIFLSDYNLDTDGEIERVLIALQKADIHPGDVAAEVSENKNIEVIEDLYDLSPNMADLYEHEDDTQEIEEDEPQPLDEEVFLPSEPVTSTEAEPASLLLTPYREFTGDTVSAHVATPEEIKEGLLAILAVEGPMVGRLLYSRYVVSGGDARVTKGLTKKLNSALYRLVREGAVASVALPGKDGSPTTTYHLATDEAVVPRTRGPRKLEEIPHQELEEIMRQVKNTIGGGKEEKLMRETLSVLDLTKLTSNAKTVLQRAIDTLHD